MAVHVFAYGTLMHADILRAACGAVPASLPARLDGYRRHPVAGEDYPGIRPDAGAHVDGTLYLDVTPAQLADLDRFEGSQYERRTVTVTVADGRRFAAETYVFAEHCHHLLEAGDWSYDAFVASATERFRARYPGFHDR